MKKQWLSNAGLGLEIASELCIRQPFFFFFTHGSWGTQAKCSFLYWNDIYIYIYLYIYILYKHEHKHKHIHIYIYIYVYKINMYIYIHIYIYAYIHVFINRNDNVAHEF